MAGGSPVRLSQAHKLPWILARSETQAQGWFLAVQVGRLGRKNTRHIYIYIFQAFCPGAHQILIPSQDSGCPHLTAWVLTELKPRRKKKVSFASTSPSLDGLITFYVQGSPPHVVDQKATSRAPARTTLKASSRSMRLPKREDACISGTVSTAAGGSASHGNSMIKRSHHKITLR